MIYVLAIIDAVPGKREQLLTEVLRNTPAVLAEEGCIEYRAVVDAADPVGSWASFGPDVLVIVEKWSSRAALKAHSRAPHMVAYAAKVKDLVASRAVHVLEPVDAA
jgi:quinol monooxygenase YgiN